MQGASSHIDISQRKLCVAALVRLLKVWGGEAGFKQYAIDSVGIQCCVLGMLSGGVDVRDGGVLGLLTEVLFSQNCLQVLVYCSLRYCSLKTAFRYSWLHTLTLRARTLQSFIISDSCRYPPK